MADAQLDTPDQIVRRVFNDLQFILDHHRGEKVFNRDNDFIAKRCVEHGADLLLNPRASQPTTFAHTTVGELVLFLHSLGLELKVTTTRHYEAVRETAHDAGYERGRSSCGHPETS